jgi:hypothetical protein
MVTNISYVGFEVLAPVGMRICVLWGITSCTSACYLLHAGFLLDLFFDPEDGTDMFFRNIGLRGVIFHKKSLQILVTFMHDPSAYLLDIKLQKYIVKDKVVPVLN